MELIKVRDENGLGLTVTEEVPEDCEVILGGMDTSPSWEEYLSDYTDEFKPHLRLIKKAIEDLGWVGYKADSAQGCYFVFSDQTALSFTLRGWGDLMSAIVGKNEGYIAYYI